MKVLRPGMEQTVAADLGVMTLPVRIAAEQGFDRAMDVLGFLVGLREQVAEELDLRNEARALESRTSGQKRAATDPRACSPGCRAASTAALVS